MLSYALLVLSIVAYAVAIVAQAAAVRREQPRSGADLGLLGRMLGDPIYLTGFAGQVIGFGTAFLARAHLPLFLVQAATSAAVALSAILGYLLLGWTLRRVEVVAIVVIGISLVLLVGAAEPSTPTDPGMRLATGFAIVLALTVAASVAALRGLPGEQGAPVLGLLSGIAFAILAIASRPLLALLGGPLMKIVFGPWLWLAAISAVLGQAVAAAGYARGSATSVVAPMVSATVAFSAVAGLAFLGDTVVPGRGWWVALGLVLVIVTVAALGRRSVPAHEAPEDPDEPAEPLTDAQSRANITLT